MSYDKGQKNRLRCLSLAKHENYESSQRKTLIEWTDELVHLGTSTQIPIRPQIYSSSKNNVQPASRKVSSQEWKYKNIPGRYDSELFRQEQQLQEKYAHWKANNDEMSTKGDGDRVEHVQINIPSCLSSKKESHTPVNVTKSKHHNKYKERIPWLTLPSCSINNLNHHPFQSPIQLQQDHVENSLSLIPTSTPTPSICFHKLKDEWESRSFVKVDILEFSNRRDKLEKEKSENFVLSPSGKSSKLENEIEGLTKIPVSEDCWNCDNPEFQRLSEEAYNCFKFEINNLLASSTGDVVLNRRLRQDEPAETRTFVAVSNPNDGKQTWFDYIKYLVGKGSKTKTSDVQKTTIFDQQQMMNEKEDDKILRGKINQLVAAAAASALARGWYAHSNETLGFRSKSGKHLCEECARNELLKQKLAFYSTNLHV